MLYVILCTTAFDFASFCTLKRLIFHEYIDLRLMNKLHEPMHYKIGDVCRRDTYFDAFFCLYHVILCARSDDVTACFFVDSDILNKKDVLWPPKKYALIENETVYLIW